MGLNSLWRRLAKLERVKNGDMPEEDEPDHSPPMTPEKAALWEKACEAVRSQLRSEGVVGAVTMDQWRGAFLRCPEAQEFAHKSVETDLCFGKPPCGLKEINNRDEANPSSLDGIGEGECVG